jgi:hypothetical protein
MQDDEHVTSALSYFNHPGQRSAGGYSDDDWKVIGERIMSKLSGKHKMDDEKIVSVEEESSAQPHESETTQVQASEASPVVGEIEETAFCTKCGKDVKFAKKPKKGTVLNRLALIGECEHGHKIMRFVKESMEQTQVFGELLVLREAPMSTDAHEVELRILQPGWSANGRYYSPDCIREAAPLFTGIKAYADHPTRAGDVDRPERSIRDIIGYYPRAWVAEDGSLRGVLRVVGESISWLWPLIVETVTNSAELVQASINALGQVEPGEVDGRKGNVVKRIVKATSTDVVTQAAAGGQFERLLASDGSLTSELLHAMSYEEFVTSRPDFVDRMRAEMKTARKDELTEAARLELAEAHSKASGLADRVAILEAELAQSKAEVSTLVESARSEVTHEKESVEAELASLRANSMARESVLLARVRVLEANVPVVLRDEAVRSISGMNEEQALQTLESMRSKWRGMVLESGRVPVSDNGPVPKAAPPRTNAVARVLGVEVVPLDGERPEEYAARKRAITEGKQS